MPVAAQNTQQTGSEQRGTWATQSPQQSGGSDEQHRSAANIPSNQTAPEREYSDYALNYDEGDAAFDGKIPDVLLDAPVVKLDNLDFELDDLRAKVSLFAKVLDLVELSVGIDAYLGKVKLTIEAIEVQALLKVRLDNVRAILDRVLTTIDRNPQIIHELAKGVSSAVEDVGEGASEAVEDVGEGAGEAVEDVGEGAGSAVEDVGGRAGEAVGEVGRGAGGAAQEVGQGAGQATQQAGEAVQQAGEVAQGVGDSAGQTAQQAQDDGAGQATEQQAPAATQAARRLAEKLGVDLAQIEGSGVGERITVTDVRGATQKR
jgi:hypothetical protein